MKFTCEKQALLSAITYTSGAVALKNEIQALEGILINAGETLRLTGFNLKIGINSDVEATIIQEGSIVLSAKLFGDIVRKLPDDIVTVSSDDTLMTKITCGISRFNIMGISSEDYPDLPTVNSEHTFEMNQTALATCISQTVYAVSDGDIRPVHSGCLFTVTPGKLTVAAVDSFRLAVRNEAIDVDDSFKFVAPGDSLKETSKILNETDEPVKISLGRSHVMFEIGSNTLITRILEGDFLDYDKVLPTEASIKVVVNRQSFSECVERVALVISEKYRTYIRCVFENNSATMAAATAVGSSHDEAPIAGDGKGLVIGFNSRYMLEALKNAPEQELLFEMNDSGKPIVIKPADPDNTSFMFMVMPIRLSN